MFLESNPHATYSYNTWWHLCIENYVHSRIQSQNRKINAHTRPVIRCVFFLSFECTSINKTNAFHKIWNKEEKNPMKCASAHIIQKSERQSRLWTLEGEIFSSAITIMCCCCCCCCCNNNNNKMERYTIHLKLKFYLDLFDKSWCFLYLRGIPKAESKKNTKFVQMPHVWHNVEC